MKTLLFAALLTLLTATAQDKTPSFYTLADFGPNGFARDPFGDPLPESWYNEIPSNGFDEESYSIKAVSARERDNQGRALVLINNPDNRITSNIIVYGLNSKQQRTKMYLVQLLPKESAWFNLASEDGIDEVEIESARPFEIKRNLRGKTESLKVDQPLKPHPFDIANKATTNSECLEPVFKLKGLVINALTLEGVEAWFDAHVRDYQVDDYLYLDIQHLDVYWPLKNRLYHTTHLNNFDSDPDNDDDFWTTSCSSKDTTFIITNRVDDPTKIHFWLSPYRAFHNPGVESLCECHFELCESSGLFWYYIILDTY